MVCEPNSEVGTLEMERRLLAVTATVFCSTVLWGVQILSILMSSRAPPAIRSGEGALSVGPRRGSWSALAPRPAFLHTSSSLFRELLFSLFWRCSSLSVVLT